MSAQTPHTFDNLSASRCTKLSASALMAVMLVSALALALAVSAACPLTVCEREQAHAATSNEPAAFEDGPVSQAALTLRESARDCLVHTICTFAVDPATLPAETVVDPIIVKLYGDDAFFTMQSIPDEVFARMDGVTFPEYCPVTREELCYLRLLHVDAQGQTKIGEMVVNWAIAEDVCDIFRELYEAGYPIERIRLACDYGGDDEASMEDDNTSAFNCRLIEGTSEFSRHSYGMAVDINTLYNPYYQPSSGLVLPYTAGEYVDRSVVGPYTIEDGDLCCQLFLEHGFEWGGYWTSPKDYQHFEQ